MSLVRPRFWKAGAANREGASSANFWALSTTFVSLIMVMSSYFFCLCEKAKERTYLQNVSFCTDRSFSWAPTNGQGQLESESNSATRPLPRWLGRIVGRVHEGRELLHRQWWRNQCFQCSFFYHVSQDSWCFTWSPSSWSQVIAGVSRLASKPQVCSVQACREKCQNVLAYKAQKPESKSPHLLAFFENPVLFKPNLWFWGLVEEADGKVQKCNSG